MASTGSIEEQLASERNPSRRLDLIRDALRPPEPQLLDTSVIQNLDWVDRVIAAGQGHWTQDREQALRKKLGNELADDLFDLGTLYKQFEDDGGYPWLVCQAAIDETALLKGSKGQSVRELLQFLADHQQDWGSDSYPGLAQGLLFPNDGARPSPLILRALGVSDPKDILHARGPLSFLPDQGDRITAAYALLANIPAILTTDRRTFWAHRSKMEALGVRILRPSELLELYAPYWEALSAEYAKRRSNPSQSR